MTLVYDLIEFTEYHSPDGEVYHFDAMDRFLISEAGFGMPDLKFIEQRAPMQHGKSIFDYRLEPRIIQLIFRENGCSRDEMWDNRANILNIIKPDRQSPGVFDLGVLRKILPDGSIRDIDVLVQQGPEFRARVAGRWDEWAIHEIVRFIAPNPIFYDPTVYTLTFDTSGGSPVWPFTWPFTWGFTIAASVVYDGTWREYPTITLTGPLEGLVIENASTNEHIDLSSYNIAAGETVTISLVYGNKTIVSSIAGNIISYMDTDSDLSTFHFGCIPECAGGINTINISGSLTTAATEIEFTYKKRHIGL
jgi:hypothetical protein